MMNQGIFKCSSDAFAVILTRFLYSNYRIACFTYQIAALSDSLRVLADMKEPVGDILKRTEVVILLFGPCNFVVSTCHYLVLKVSQ